MAKKSHGEELLQFITRFDLDLGALKHAVELFLSTTTESRMYCIETILHVQLLIASFVFLNH